MSPSDPGLAMWARACRLLEQAERLQRYFFHPAGPAAWQAPVDVFETDQDVHVVVALPGVPPAGVTVAIEADGIAVAGSRRLAGPAGARIRRLEIPHGRFERRISLPMARLELVRRDLADGCLWLVLRKAG